MRDLIARTTTWTSSPPGASAKDYVAITDHLGSPIVLLRVQAGGALGFLAEPAESISYDPYGRPTVHVPFGTSLPGQPAFTAKGWLVEARGATARTGVRSIHSRVDTAWVPLTLWGPLASMSSTGWRLLFTQRDYEPGAQAYWYRLRWYDPAQGRFWSRDPLGYEPGLVQYAYCNGNPVNFTDPWGLKVDWWNPFTWGDPDEVEFGPKMDPDNWEPPDHDETAFDGFLDGAEDGYTGWSVATINYWIPFTGNYTDPCNPYQQLGYVAGEIQHETLDRLANRGKGRKPPRRGLGAADGERDWNLGKHKSKTKWNNRLSKRGWTEDQIDEALSAGQKFPAPNKVNPGNGATRYVHPVTGRSVILDDVTKEVLLVGGDGFKF